MQKYFKWFTLQLKSWVKSKAFWIQTVVMLLALWIITGISIPSGEVTEVGIGNANGYYSQKIEKTLQEKDTAFEFVSYQNLEQLKQDVESGKIECGFWFEDDFEENFESGSTRQQIQFISTPFVAKGFVAKETFYTAYLDVSGEVILRDASQEYFEDDSTQAFEMIQEKYEELKTKEDSFRVDMVEVTVGEDTSAEPNPEGKTYPLQGVLGLFLFLMMLLNGKLAMEKGSKGYLSVLNKRDGFVFLASNNLAVTIVPAIIGVLVISMGRDSRGIAIESLSMLLFLIVSCVWVTVITALAKEITSVISWSMALLIAQIVICPVFVELSVFLYGMQYIRMLFPLGIYLFL